MSDAFNCNAKVIMKNEFEIAYKVLNARLDELREEISKSHSIGSMHRVMLIDRFAELANLKGAIVYAITGNPQRNEARPGSVTLVISEEQASLLSQGVTFAIEDNDKHIAKIDDMEPGEAQNYIRRVRYRRRVALGALHQLLANPRQRHDSDGNFN